MKSISKLYDLVCQDQNIKTLTFDVFDTILMRKIHPENQQFLLVAKKWLPLFRKNINSKITVEKIYSLRLYARNELFDIYNKYVKTEKDVKRHIHYDVTLESWFKNLVYITAMLYNVKITETAATQMVKEMITIELETEIDKLIPNRPLINCIKQLKKSRPDLKIYFVSDMYLTTKQVKMLLSAHDITCFDDGITSTDVKSAKYDASIFYQLSRPEIFGSSFELSANLHVGDNRTADYIMPRRAGSEAFWLKNIHQVVENKANHRKIAQKMEKLQKTELFRLQHELKAEKTSDIWIKYGELFSLPLFSFLAHVAISANNAPDTTFILTSSEAKFFGEITKAEFADVLSRKNVIIADKLNRRMMFRALIYQLLKNDNFEHNLRSIMGLINYGEVDGSRFEAYKFIFGEEYPCGEMSLNLRNDKDFFKTLYHEITYISTKRKRELKNAYDYVLMLVTEISQRAVIVDVGWGGTVQILFTEFCNNLDSDKKISGLYLGAHPADRFPIKHTHLDGYLMPNIRDSKDRTIWNAVLWEYAYTNKPQFEADEYRLKLICRGMHQGAEYFRNLDLAPYDYFNLVSKKYLCRLIGHPSRAEVETLGDIEFDSGFVDKTSFKLVDMRYSQRAFYKMMLRHPRGTVKNIIFAQNHWLAGYIKYYHLFGLRAALKIYGKFNGKKYI